MKPKSLKNTLLLAVAVLVVIGGLWSGARGCRRASGTDAVGEAVRVCRGGGCVTIIDAVLPRSALARPLDASGNPIHVEGECISPPQPPYIL